MYIPQPFAVTDRAFIHDFMRCYSFATLVTGGAEPFATHLPLLFDEAARPNGTLFGHFAGPNTHWKLDHQAHSSLAIFHGPHGYISPTASTKILSQERFLAALPAKPKIFI
jgi:transcriptional regulator